MFSHSFTMKNKECGELSARNAYLERWLKHNYGSGTSSSITKWATSPKRSRSSLAGRLRQAQGEAVHCRQAVTAFCARVRGPFCLTPARMTRMRRCVRASPLRVRASTYGACTRCCLPHAPTHALQPLPPALTHWHDNVPYWSFLSYTMRVDCDLENNDLGWGVSMTKYQKRFC